MASDGASAPHARHSAYRLIRSPAFDRVLDASKRSSTYRAARDRGCIAQAADARRQRIVISQSTVGPVKWTAILLQGLCALIAIAMVHSDNRLTCAIAVAIFATGIALSSLLIAAYGAPFSGDISVGPELLQQVIPSETSQPTAADRP